MRRLIFLIVILGFSGGWQAQLFIARDTIPVIENGKILKMPWAGGINFSNVSSIDLNMDGKKDLVVFDKINLFSVGRFRCFIHSGLAGQATYSCNPELSYKFPPASNWAILKDYNCDGKEDIFCSTSAGIMVYRNTSTTAGLSFVLAKSLLYTTFPSGPVNLYASVNAIPGIEDIDGDGDLDILTFAPQGVVVEYHKNMSKETYSTCDSLNYEISSGCWGNIMENNCTVTMNFTCSMKSPVVPQNSERGQPARGILSHLFRQ
jgi:hypothetical protein